MAKSILITGGARSGKSVFAEGITLSLADPAIYIATAEALDAEMSDRIARHRARRGPQWHTIAEPLDLARALKDSDGGLPRLVDCVTLWVSNLMHAQRDPVAAAEEICALLPDLQSPVILVTNEVGSGIVPDNALARAYRDAAGLCNQHLGRACDEVWLVVSGQALKVKPQ